MGDVEKRVGGRRDACPTFLGWSEVFRESNKRWVAMLLRLTDGEKVAVRWVRVVGGLSSVSGENASDHVVLFDSGEALVEAEVGVGEATVVDAHEVQDGGVKVAHVAAFFDGFET